MTFRFYVFTVLPPECPERPGKPANIPKPALLLPPVCSPGLGHNVLGPRNPGCKKGREKKRLLTGGALKMDPPCQLFFCSQAPPIRLPCSARGGGEVGSALESSGYACFVRRDDECRSGLASSARAALNIHGLTGRRIVSGIANVFFKISFTYCIAMNGATQCMVFRQARTGALEPAPRW